MRMVPLTLVLASILLGSCAKPATPPKLDISAGPTEQTLRPYVGKQITVTGLWDPYGKESGFVRGPDGSTGEPIYVQATTQAGREKENELYKVKPGTPIEITGILHFVDPPPPPPALSASAATSQSVPKHFYFDVAQATVRFLNQ